MPTEKQRRQAERRRVQRQLHRRRQREAARRRRLLIVSILGILAVIGLVVGFVVATGNDDTSPAAGKSTTSLPSSTAPSSPSPSPAAAPYPCVWKKAGSPAKKVTVPSSVTPPRTGTARVSVRTNRGTLGFTLNRAAAPCAAQSFVSLAKQKFFDSTPCHRLTSKGIFVLQCGDPSGSGSGGPGYTFGDEVHGNEKYARGVLAMANRGPNTNGSQFFIVYKNSTLQPNYTVFGTVTSGLNVVDKVAAAGSTPAGDGKPKLPVMITKAQPAT